MDYLSLRRREFETTLRVLQAYPEDKTQNKPAEKSKTAAELAMTLVNEERVIAALLDSAAASPSAWSTERPSSMSAIVGLWQQAASRNDTSLARLSRDAFERSVDFYGRPMSLGDALWLELLDHIHHRGQFSVYLRIAGARVPSIYGPTADVPWPSVG